MRLRNEFTETKSIRKIEGDFNGHIVSISDIYFPLNEETSLVFTQFSSDSCIILLCFQLPSGLVISNTNELHKLT